jgi:hypothetical protein
MDPSKVGLKQKQNLKKQHKNHPKHIKFKTITKRAGRISSEEKKI